MVEYGAKLPPGAILDEQKGYSAELDGQDGYGAELPEGAILDDPQTQQGQQTPQTGTTAPAQPPDKISLLMQKIASGAVLAPTQQEAIKELTKRGILPANSTMGIPGSMAIGESQGAKGLTREAMPALRPALEAIPAVAAGIAGAATTPVTGPMSPLVSAGMGAAGYTAGKKTADFLEKWADSKDEDPEQKPIPIIEELGYLGDDLIRGLTYEFGGAAVAPILGTLLKTPGFVKNILASRSPAMSNKEIEKRAIAIIEANTGNHPQYLKNIEESQKIIDETGIRATMGDMANDPGIIKLQRGLERSPGIASEEELFKRAENIEIMQNYLKKEFPGDEGIDNVMHELTRQKKALEKSTKAAEESAMTARGKVEPLDPQTTGVRILKEIEEARKPVRAKEKVLWEKVPDYKMQTTETEKVFKELSEKPSIARDTVKSHYEIFKNTPKTVEEMHVIEQELNDVIFDPNASNTVKRALGKVKTALAKDFDLLGEAAEQGDFATYKGDVVHPKRLAQDLDELNIKLKAGDELTPDKIDAEKTYSELEKANIPGTMQQRSEGKEEYAKRIAKIYKINFGKDAPVIPGQEKATVTQNKARKAAIEETLAGAEPAQNAAIAYKNAKAYSASQNFKRFGKGAVAELRQKGKYADGMKIPAEARPKKLMNVDDADQFIEAVGKEKAGDIMLRHYADDMMSKVSYDESGQLQAKSLTNWVNKNKHVLDRYGIKNYFDSVDSAHSAMLSAREAEKQFNNSIAAKLLDSDPQNALARAFSGGEGISAKNTGKIMQNLLNRMEGNKRGIKALQNAFKDFMYETTETTAKSIKDSKVLSNATLAKQMRRFKPAMAVLYKDQPSKIKALQTMEKAVAMQNRTAKAPIGGGSDTSENLSVIADIIGPIITHTPGASYLVKLGKLGLSAFKNINIKDTNNLVARMLHDPELAQIIIHAAKVGPANKKELIKINTNLSKYFVAAGLRKTNLDEQAKTITQDIINTKEQAE